MPPTSAPAPNRRHAQLVWLDPGSTTGVCALSVRTGWLEGQGDGSWAGLGRAVVLRWLSQVGRDAREVDAVGGKVRTPARRARYRYPDHLSATTAGEMTVVHACENLLDEWPDAAWGYEGFTPGLSVPGGPDYLAPVRIFSALTYVELVYGENRRAPFVQAASIAKTTATDERLRAAGLYQPGMGHATDAARHAATFLRRARADAELRHAAWPKLFKINQKESA